MSKQRNKGQNKPPTKPSASAPAQRQQDQAGPQEGQTTLQEDQATLQKGQTTLQVSRTEFSGPLPPADELEKYERVFPGAAERIIAMAERESSHRHASVDNEYKEASRGQIYAVIIGALAIICGTIAGVSGAQWTGSVIAGIGGAGLVSAFIRGRRGN